MVLLELECGSGAQIDEIANQQHNLRLDVEKINGRIDTLTEKLSGRLDTLVATLNGYKDTAEATLKTYVTNDDLKSDRRWIIGILLTAVVALAGLIVALNK